MLVVGVDGCPGGWLAVIYDPVVGTLVPVVHKHFADLVETYPDAACIAVDIPIGMAEGRSRRCDVEARRVLGDRRSSVFPAPDARVVGVGNYAEALARSRALTGKGISRQAFGIYPKVAEVNAVMTPALQERIVEVHPEVSFQAMAGGLPMRNAKRKSEGFAERHALLQRAFEGIHIPDRQEARRIARPAAPDDVLDAIVAAWTAHRFATGVAGRFPVDPETDGRGLRMEIVF